MSRRQESNTTSHPSCPLTDQPVPRLLRDPPIIVQLIAQIVSRLCCQRQNPPIAITTGLHPTTLLWMALVSDCWAITFGHIRADPEHDDGDKEKTPPGAHRRPQAVQYVILRRGATRWWPQTDLMPWRPPVHRRPAPFSQRECPAGGPCVQILHYLQNSLLPILQ